MGRFNSIIIILLKCTYKFNAIPNTRHFFFFFFGGSEQIVKLTGMSGG